MEVATRRREQEVWQACDDLWALHGDNSFLTGDAIRERLVVLGKSRGSPNEIYKYRKSWSLSRCIDKQNNNSSENMQEQDPISRAVRMVHEKLLGEADEKIAALKTTHSAEMLEQNQLLTQKNNDLARIISELEHAHHELNKTQNELAQTKAMLHAEIDSRKAQEREYMHAKASNQQIVEELKAVHKDTCEQLMNSFQAQEQERKAFIERLEADKKLLGYEFSEKITEIKTLNYSQDICIKNLSAKSESQALEIQEKTEIINNQTSKLKVVFEQCLSLQALNQEIANNLKNITEELSRERNKNKRSDVSIARLRAMRHREIYHERSYDQKGATQRIAASHNPSAKASKLDLQNPSP